MSLFELVWLLSHCNQYDSAIQDVLIFNRVCMKDSQSWVSVGIDVSKATLAVACIATDRSVVTFTVSNSRIGLRTIRKKVSGFTGRILMESTGRYHLLAALVLFEAGMAVVVINPLLSAHYSATSVRKLKTDKADAIKLGEIALLHPELPLFTLTKDDLLVRQKIGLLAALEKQLQRFKSTLNGFQEFERQLVKQHGSEEIQALNEQVKLIEKHMHHLETEIIQAVASTHEHQEECALLESIPGISHYGASLLVHYLQNWEERGRGSKKLVAYFGFDVSVRESGMWKGKGKLSKRGNRYIRKRLFSAAWGAMMVYEEFRTWYKQLRKQGRKHREALIIIARKLLIIAHAVLKSKQPYSAAIAFPS